MLAAKRTLQILHGVNGTYSHSGLRGLTDHGSFAGCGSLWAGRPACGWCDWRRPCHDRLSGYWRSEFHSRTVLRQ